MISTTVYTEEIDDMQVAAEELYSQLKDFTVRKNTLGIIFCDMETNENELVKELHNYYDFPIIGATAVALLTNNEGYRNIGITLMIMTSNSCEFLTDETAELTAENAEQEIAATYKRLKAKLTQPEKLALVYAPQMSFLTGDYIVKYYNKVNPEGLIFGGIASDNFELTSNRIFFNESSSQKKVILVLIGGNLKPVFQQQYSIIDTKGIMSTVTKSQDNIVYEVTEGKFLDVLKNKGMDINDANADAYLKFVCSVFEANIDVGNNEYISVMRDLRSINFEEGSAIFLGNVPVGSKMRLCVLNKENINSTVRRAFIDVLAQIKQNSDYHYTTFLCTSCAGRFLNLATEPDFEGKVCQELTPPGLSLCGMYSYGEICPTKAPSGRCYNIFHNKTFTLVAF